MSTHNRIEQNRTDEQAQEDLQRGIISPSTIWNLIFIRVILVKR